MLQEFLGALSDLTVDAIRALALDIDGMGATPADEVELTRAFLHIEKLLRQHRRTREAAMAGRRAGQAVIGAAERAGVELPDDAVTRVARWATTVARGIVAEHGAEPDVIVLGHACEHNAELAVALAFSGS